MIHRSFGYIYLHNQDWVLNASEIVIKNTGSKITSSSNTIISLSLLIMLLRCSWKMFLASRCIWWYNADFSNVTFSMYRSMFCYDNVLPIFFHNDSLERKLKMTNSLFSEQHHLSKCLKTLLMTPSFAVNILVKYTELHFRCCV